MSQTPHTNGVSAVCPRQGILKFETHINNFPKQEKMPKGIIAGFYDTYLIRIIMSNMEEHVFMFCGVQ